MKVSFPIPVARDVQEDDDVLFGWWTLFSLINVDDDTSQALLPHTVDHYIIVQGFTFAVQ